MIEVHTWEPNANSGKPLLCLHEKQVPFVHRYVDMLGAHNATAFASKVDPAEKALRLATMPNREVRRKWERVFERGYDEDDLAEARTRLARVADRLETHLAQGRPWLLGDDYSLADVKWYSMVPGLPRLVPELCNGEITPAIMVWVERMAARQAVQQLDSFRPTPATDQG